jgi:hypothetical protein
MAAPPVAPGSVDTKAGTRILLAAFWLCHLALWTFGDMFALLQEMTEPVTSTLITFIAPTTAIVQVLMVAGSLVGRQPVVRWANLIVVLAYLLFNIGFLIDATEGWEYYLGAFYLVFNLLIFWTAFRWTAEE